MTNSLEDEIQRIVANMDNEQHSQEQEQPDTTEQEKEPAETIHIHYFPDAIVILKEDENTAQIVDSAPLTPQKISFIPAYVICSLYLFLIFSCIAFQAYEILNPPIATVTIIPKSQQLTLNGTLQLGRVLPLLTISQSQTTATTGKGHQNAKQATGFITFYNGQFQSVTIAAGTVLTGGDGIQIITDQDVIIPAANPPIFGQTTVSARAIISGNSGNIGAYDINTACCFASVLAKNPERFSGGQDERNFQTVSKADIASVATPLKTAVAQSMSGALQGQVQPPEQLFILPCTPTQTADYQPGEEAREVKVTLSETCSAVAYNTNALEEKVVSLLTSKAQSKLAGYSLFGDIQIKVNQASVSSTSPPLVFLSCKATGTWIYGLSRQSQERIKELIAGKTKVQALQMLASMPGVEQASIRFSGFGDATRLPKNSTYIHIILVVM